MAAKQSWTTKFTKGMFSGKSPWNSINLCMFICLVIFSSIYLFSKPFILYYKIEELKMLFIELNIRLQE